MSPEAVLSQFRDIYSRLILSGLSVKQFPPTDRGIPGGGRRIGDIAAAATGLKNVPYDLIYDELDKNDAYHVKMPDGGLLLFQYTFAQQSELVKHRLAFFPSSVLPSLDEAPYL